MLSYKDVIIDIIGLHARPASKLVSSIRCFESDMFIISKGQRGNLQSIMNVMAMGIKHGDEFEITVSGSDEVEAMKSIKELMKKEGLV